MNLTLPDLAAIDEEYKRTNGPEGAASHVGCQLLRLWDKWIIGTDYAAAIAERIMPVLFSPISNIPFVDVPAAPEDHTSRLKNNARVSAALEMGMSALFRNDLDRLSNENFASHL
jgi:hypothetical protein